jgi:hypothetical protein
MRELQLTGDQEGLTKAFSDIEQLARNCRFRNCSHQNEPGCAIREALTEGDISLDRFEQYEKLKMETSVANNRRRIKKPKATPNANIREEKESFFKDIAVRKRKAEKAQRKFGRRDEF